MDEEGKIHQDVENDDNDKMSESSSVEIIEEIPRKIKIEVINLDESDKKLSDNEKDSVPEGISLSCEKESEEKLLENVTSDCEGTSDTPSCDDELSSDFSNVPNLSPLSPASTSEDEFQEKTIIYLDPANLHRDIEKKFSRDESEVKRKLVNEHLFAMVRVQNDKKIRSISGAIIGGVVPTSITYSLKENRIIDSKYKDDTDSSDSDSFCKNACNISLSSETEDSPKSDWNVRNRKKDTHKKKLFPFSDSDNDDRSERSFNSSFKDEDHRSDDDLQSVKSNEAHHKRKFTKSKRPTNPFYRRDMVKGNTSEDGQKLSKIVLKADKDGYKVATKEGKPQQRLFEKLKWLKEVDKLPKPGTEKKPSPIVLPEKPKEYSEEEIKPKPAPTNFKIPKEAAFLDEDAIVETVLEEMELKSPYWAFDKLIKKVPDDNSSFWKQENAIDVLQKIALMMLDCIKNEGHIIKLRTVIEKLSTLCAFDFDFWENLIEKAFDVRSNLPSIFKKRVTSILIKEIWDAVDKEDSMMEPNLAERLIELRKSESSY